MLMDPKKFKKDNRLEDLGMGPKVVITPDNAERLGFEILLDENGEPQKTETGVYVSRRFPDRSTNAGYFPNFLEPIEKRVQETPKQDVFSSLITLPNNIVWNMIKEDYAKVTNFMTAYDKRTVFSDDNNLPSEIKSFSNIVTRRLNGFHRGARTMQRDVQYSLLYEGVKANGVEMLDSFYLYNCNIRADDPLFNLRIIGGDDYQWSLSFCVMEVKGLPGHLYQVTAGKSDTSSPQQRHKWLLGAGSLDGYGGRTDYAELDFWINHRRKF